MADHDDHSHFLPSFFKIILEFRDDLQKLAIPEKFMSDYGSDLSEVVTLKIPTGKTWEVDLIEENERTWLRDGWPEFVKYYSICHGHFLVFRYEGNSVFNVYIFDMTASEIDYPLDDLEETRDIQERPALSQIEYPLDDPKTTRTRTNSIASPRDNRLVALVNQCRRKLGRDLTRKDVSKLNSYKFEHPCFAVVMQPSFVNYKFCLHVPSIFGAEYLRRAKGCIILQNDSGDTWPIKWIGKSKFKKFSGGWKGFALDNKLRVGDICVFELIKVLNAKYLFKVEIIRSSSSPPLATPTGSKTTSSDVQERQTKTARTRTNSIASARGNGMVALVNQYRRKFERNLTRRDLEEINSHVFEYPCFAVIMQPSFVEYKFRLGVPAIFAAKYLRSTQGSFTLENGSGGTWPISCTGKPRKRKFCGGWKSFALDNKLRVGDICVFELIKVLNAEHLFKVEIIRSSSSSPVIAPGGSRTSSEASVEVIKVEI